MNQKERILKILRIPHLSEKVSLIMKKNNTVALKVLYDSNKIEIKNAVQNLFKVKVDKVNTLINKGKIKRYSNKLGRRKNWKKAYVTLKKGQNLDFLNL